MSKILLIETSTTLCSVALADDGCADHARGSREAQSALSGEGCWQIVASRRSEEPRQHASLTAVFIDEVLREAGLIGEGAGAGKPGNGPLAEEATVDLRGAGLAAVALSAGPGSYTGLRVGSSTAKGICFGAGVPLISVGTLDILAWQGLAAAGSSLASGQAGAPALAAAEGLTILPMIDARRSEVYTAQYRVENGVPVRKTEVAPVILEAGSFADLFAAGPVLVIGDGAAKFADLLGADATREAADSGSNAATAPAAASKGNALFIQCCPEAEAMLQPAIKKFEAGEFENIAYFEPFYLKDFVATVGKKLF